MPPVRAVVALGSNMEDPEAQVRRAFAELAAIRDTWVVARSQLHRTAPVGYAGQPDFVNACALVETRLAPRELLGELLAIERRHGRVRDIPNGPRTLDLDVILYGGATVDEPGLVIPHPRAHERAFVLEPLLEVWPEAEIPGKGKASELLAAVPPASDAVAPASDAVAPASDAVAPAKAGAQLGPGLRRGDGTSGSGGRGDGTSGSGGRGDGASGSGGRGDDADHGRGGK
jgi:2-amino-4-hydroxy-6-hydroxymethyldihydropteridine diphosphokinase